jgi:hypothetical protein
LAQGDIFSLPLVAPLADDEIRVLRTESGQHGFHVFQDGEPGRIFSYADLVETIGSLPPEDQVPPFPCGEGVPPEMVVVYGDLFQFFIVASQTCDVSGVDARPKPFAAVLPVVTLAGFLSREELPIGVDRDQMQDRSQYATIVDYLQTALRIDLSSERGDPFALPGRVRDLLRQWKPRKGSPEQRVRGKMVEWMNGVVDARKTYVYYLPAEKTLGIPEGYIDFTRLYSVLIGKVQELMTKRKATLVSPYREEFASKLGTYLSRIATPAPLKPPKV